MKKFIVFAHDSRYEILADEMSTFNGNFEFDVREIHGTHTNSETVAVITPFGYAYAEDTDFQIFELGGE